MKVLITGANGFVGKNLQVHLAERQDVQVVCLNRRDDLALLPVLLADVDCVFHLAGVNRPQDPADFMKGNQQLTQQLCAAIVASARPIPVVYTSSIQATLDNAYGVSKLAAEQALLALADETGSPVYLYRLPNVFGKWSRPNYNSAVATFCNNIARSLPIQINDANAVIHLVYIDDVIADFIAVLAAVSAGVHRREIAPLYSITVGALAEQIQAFKDSRTSMVTEAVGQGLTRALYSTYLSFLSPEQFSYEIPVHADPRGRFVEMLKTKDSGQFSFFTAHPKVTRGGHYHHSKNEKFLVIQGKARFAFRHVVTGETYELMTNGASPTIVETVPGWSHDITNIGEEEMIVMLWANEIFDRQNPDTISHKV